MVQGTERRGEGNERRGEDGTSLNARREKECAECEEREEETK